MGGKVYALFDDSLRHVPNSKILSFIKEWNHKGIRKIDKGEFNKYSIGKPLIKSLEALR